MGKVSRKSPSANNPKSKPEKTETFEIPALQMFCVACGATNYFYDDSNPPYHLESMPPSGVGARRPPPAVFTRGRGKPFKI
jgi:hypothetical protein